MLSVVEREVGTTGCKSQTREFLLSERSKCFECSGDVRYGSVMTEGGESYGFPLFCIQRCDGMNNWSKVLIFSLGMKTLLLLAKRVGQNKYL